MIPEVTKKVFRILNTIKPVSDQDIISLYENIAVYRDFNPMWTAVMRNLHGEEASSTKLDPELEDFFKFVQNEVLGQLSNHGLTFQDIPVYHYGTGRSIYALSVLSHRGAIRKDQARLLLREVLLQENIGYDLEDILAVTSVLDEADTAELEIIVKAVLQTSAKAIAEYKSGKDKAIGSIMGQVMRQMKADPQVVTQMIKRLISEG